MVRLFWDDSHGRVSYAIKGLLFLVDQFFWLAFGVLIALIMAVVLGRLLKRRLFKVVDSAPWVILGCVCLAVAADAIVLRHTQADQYLSDTKIEDMLHTFRELGAPPKIVAPIYFHYVDTNRVDSLYNQLEPELEVKEREVTGKNTLKADATAGVGGTKIGVEAGSESGTKSTYSPANLLIDRKCVDVMKYVQDTWPDNYFGPLWAFRKAYLRGLDAAYKQVQSLADPSTLKPLQPLGDNEGKPPNNLGEADDGTRLELLRLHGYIFIEGDFEQTVTGNNVILVHRFMDRPKCLFRAFLPISASRMLPKTKPLHLTVFGDVTRPLGDDGFIDVAAIAVY